MQIRSIVAGIAALLSGTAAIAAVPFVPGGNQIKPGYEFRKPPLTPIAGDISTDTNGRASATFGNGGGAGSPVGLGFEGISQYDGASLGRNFIPSDGVAAAGRTQIVQTTNGGVAVYDKATGARTSLVSDNAFWQALGQAGSSGDQRVMYNEMANRWIVIGFGANAKDIQIAVSQTANALGPYKVTQFEGFSNGFSAPIADYPTLAIDRNAVYIGTNDFGAATPGGVRSFRGTTLNVIPLADLFGKTPTAANRTAFVTPFNSASTTNDFTRGFAIQGVNSREKGTTTGNIAAVSINAYAVTRYDVANAGTAGATRTAGLDVGSPYIDNMPARQPAAIAANQRIVDTLGDRISSSVYENDGKIYAVHTITPTGTDETRVRFYVIDSATNVVLDEGEIGERGYDYYQGSIAVNALGQVVIGYNRSGLSPTDGRITLLARVFQTQADGSLLQKGAEQLLKESLVDDYHNGSIFGRAAVGRQRWQDYSSVSVDPLDPHGFWVEGGFAREYNLPQFGHPGGTGGSRWSTWISKLSVGSVPEPQTWAMFIVGFGLVGGAMRRQRTTATA
jgi:hypothetical protein